MNNKVIKALRRLAKWNDTVYKPMLEKSEQLRERNAYLTMENERLRKMNIRLIHERDQARSIKKF